MGVCCLAIGDIFVCYDDVTEEQCVLAGGTWYPEQDGCEGFTCPMPGGDCRHSGADVYPVNGYAYSADLCEVAVFEAVKPEGERMWTIATRNNIRAVRGLECGRYFGRVVREPDRALRPAICSQPRGSDTARWNIGAAVKKQEGDGLCEDLEPGTWVLVAGVETPHWNPVRFSSDRLLCGGTPA